MQSEPLSQEKNKHDNEKNVVYLSVVRAIYVCISSDLLRYKLYSETLHSIGVSINPYNRGGTNKAINGK